ncbi:hypothetical protein CHM_6g1220 [Cryptosporidium hominis]
MIFYSLFIIYYLVSSILAIELNDINSHSAVLNLEQGSEILLDKIKCSNNLETILNRNVLISTIGRFKCVYPIKILSNSNKTLYSWNSNSDNKCNYIYIKIMKQSNCEKEKNLIESISLNYSCKILAFINLNGCILVKKEILPINEKTTIIQQMNKYRLMLKSVTLKTKIIIGIILHIVLFIIALVFTRNRKYHKMTLKIYTNTKTESLEINSASELTTKVMLNTSNSI